MKKIFTILCLSLAVATTNAQEQGTILLGALTDATSAGWSEIQMMPTVGYFISDQMAVGLGLSFNSTKDEDEYTTSMGFNPAYTETNTTTGTNLMPWMRLYMNERMFATAALAIGMGSDKFESTQAGVDNTEDKTSSMALVLGGGMSLKWGDYVAIEPGITFQYGTSSVTPDGQDKINGPTTMSLGWNIGICLMMSE